jgi:hypothetical protein
VRAMDSLFWKFMDLMFSIEIGRTLAPASPSIECTEQMQAGLVPMSLNISAAR